MAADVGRGLIDDRCGTSRVGFDPARSDPRATTSAKMLGSRSAAAFITPGLRTAVPA